MAYRYGKKLGDYRNISYSIKSSWKVQKRRHVYYRNINLEKLKY